MGKYKVVVEEYLYPNGKLFDYREKYFDNLEEAKDYKESQTYVLPFSESVARIYEHKPGWIPL